MSLYLDASRPFPYCAGCGHPHVLRAIDASLSALSAPPLRVAIVTDIGCVGLADPFFPGLHTVHTLHGRSVAIAAGLAMADRAPGRHGPRDAALKPIVLIGDGGAGIGLLHLVHAAQANVDVTVLVHNNLVYGMTGGQHSVLTPPGMKTTTTPNGCPIPALDLGAILIGAGAGFLARAVAPGEDLAPALDAALRHPGFACVEILELCPTFATARGGITGKDLRAMPADRGLPLGILKQDATRPSFPQFDPDARSRSGGEASSPAGVFDEEEGVVPNPAWGGLDSPVRVLLAGRAGERVQSSAQVAAAAACAAGLSVTLRTDNPVTQGSGFSLAELRIGPGVEPMGDRGRAGDDPGPAYDLILVLAPEGQAELASRGLLPRLRGPAAARWVLDSDLPVSHPEAAGERRSLRSTYGPRNAALAVLIEESVRAGWWAPRAWWAAVDRLAGSRGAEAAGILHRIV